MEDLEIVWNQKALRRLSEITLWYEEFSGFRAASKFVTGIESTVNTLSHSPQIGTLDTRRSNSRFRYYSFLSHPKYRIIYRFSKKKIFIVTISATMMKVH